MAANTTLNAKNLEALGAARLAALLMEICAGNAPAKQRLRLALAASLSPPDLAKAIRKQLSSMGTARSVQDWRGAHAVAADLNARRTAIMSSLAPTHPDEALDLLWRLMDLADPLYSRCDDSNGDIGDIFKLACADLAKIAARVRPEPDTLARQVFHAVTSNHYGQFDGLIASMAPTLGPEGMARLKELVIDLSNRPVEKPAEKDRVTIGWAPSGPIYKDQVEESTRKNVVRSALRAIADAERNADASIPQ